MRSRVVPSKIPPRFKLDRFSELLIARHRVTVGEVREQAWTTVSAERQSPEGRVPLREVVGRKKRTIEIDLFDPAPERYGSRRDRKAAEALAARVRYVYGFDTESRPGLCAAKRGVVSVVHVASAKYVPPGTPGSHQMVRIEVMVPNVSIQIYVQGDPPHPLAGGPFSPGANAAAAAMIAERRRMRA